MINDDPSGCKRGAQQNKHEETRNLPTVVHNFWAVCSKFLKKKYLVPVPVPLFKKELVPDTVHVLQEGTSSSSSSFFSSFLTPIFMKKQNVCWALIYVHKYVLICMRNVVGEEKNYIDNIITALFSSAKFKKVAEV